MFHVLQRTRHAGAPAGYLGQAVESTKATSQARKGRGILTEIAEVALLALGLYVVINFAIQTVHVIGLSMYPTVRDQDYLVAARIDYRLHAPQRGDIIIMRDPYDASRDFIKRIIGLPGDRVLIRGGAVYINGRLLTEPYLNHEAWTQNADWPAGQQDGGSSGMVIPADEYFVMGDNRNHSSDSRLFGPIRRDQIEAHAWIRVLPVTKLGLVDGSKPSLSARVLAPQATG
jgi:signal peptidase I